MTSNSKIAFEFIHVWVHEGDVQVYNPLNTNAPPVDVGEGHKATIACAGVVILGGLSAAAIAAL